MKSTTHSLNLLTALRRQLEAVEVQNLDMAKLVCKFIPSHCPFEKTITLFGKSIHIPPFCKLNPLYDQLVELRFKALTYLADHTESTAHYI